MNMRGLIPLLLLAPLVACSQSNGAANAASAKGGARPPTEVAVITVQPGEASISREYPGRLQAWRKAEVRARVEGIVEKRLFTEGAQVTAGNSLFQIEDTTYQAALQAARTEVEVANLAVERARSLLAKNLVAPDALDEARARYQQAQAQLVQAAQDLENTHVPAPIDGRIGRAQVTEGALVGHGEPSLLATIEQIDPLYADFTRAQAERLQLKSAEQAGQLKPANSDEVRLVLGDGSLYPQPGRILFSERKVDPATGTVLVRARISNPEHLLLPGMFVRIRMPVARAENVVRIPQQAVQAGRNGLQVLVVSAEGKVLPRPIETSGMDGPDFLVSKGLQAGEQVIVEGLQKARPGSTVKAVPWQGATSASATAPAER